MAAQQLPESMEISIPDGMGGGDRIQVQAPSGRTVVLQIPRVPGATAGVVITASIPHDYQRGDVIKCIVDPWSKGRGLSGRWDDNTEDTGGGDGGKIADLEADEQLDEEEELARNEELILDAGGGTNLGVEAMNRAFAQRQKPLLGPRSQTAGTGRPLLVVRNNIVRLGRANYAIDPVMPLPSEPRPAARLMRNVRQALEDRGWVYPPDEAVDLMLHYEDPFDGTWYPLTDHVFVNIFHGLVSAQKAFATGRPNGGKLAYIHPRPKLQLRPRKTLPTKVEPDDGRNPKGKAQVIRYHANGQWQRQGRQALRCSHRAWDSTLGALGEPCGKAFTHEFELEQHMAGHLVPKPTLRNRSPKPCACPWPGCEYANARRGPLKLHWKETHFANRYRLCADSAGFRGDTDVVGQFHTLGIAGSDRYSPALFKVHTDLYNAIWCRERAARGTAEEKAQYVQGIRNALKNAAELSAGVETPANTADVDAEGPGERQSRGLIEPKLLRAVEITLAQVSQCAHVNCR